MIRKLWPVLANLSVEVCRSWINLLDPTNETSSVSAPASGVRSIVVDAATHIVAERAVWQRVDPLNIGTKPTAAAQVDGSVNPKPLLRHSHHAHHQARSATALRGKEGRGAGVPACPGIG